MRGHSQALRSSVKLRRWLILRLLRSTACPAQFLSSQFPDSPKVSKRAVGRPTWSRGGSAANYRLALQDPGATSLNSSVRRAPPAGPMTNSKVKKAICTEEASFSHSQHRIPVACFSSNGRTALTLQMHAGKNSYSPLYLISFLYE